MKSFSLYLLLFAGAACAQVLPSAGIFPEVLDETVLAIFDDGGKFTMRELRALYPALPPAGQQAAINNRKEWIQQYAFMRKLARMAESEKLDRQSPTKEALEYQRLATLSFAQINAVANSLSVDDEQVAKAYESAKENFKQVKLKVIYISFVSAAMLQSGAAKGLTEAVAGAKAEKLVEQIRGGADFVELVKAHSDDRDSKEKNGDFQTMRRSDKLPETIRSAVFALKNGEVTNPIRQPNGFYIFRAEEVTHQPLSEVRGELREQLRMKSHEKWLSDTAANTKVQLVDTEFFKPPAPKPVPAPPAPAPK